MKPAPWWVALLSLALGVGAGLLLGQSFGPTPLETKTETKEESGEVRELRAKYDAALSESETWRQLVEKRTKTTKTPVLLACDGGTPVIGQKEERETHAKTQTEADAERQRFESAVADEVAKRQATFTGSSSSKPTLSRGQFGLLGAAMWSPSAPVMPGGVLRGAARLGDSPVFVDGMLFGGGAAPLVPGGAPAVVIGAGLGISFEVK